MGALENRFHRLIHGKEFANDVIAVIQKDGEIRFSPLDVRFQNGHRVSDRDAKIVHVAIDRVSAFQLSLNQLMSKSDRAFHKSPEPSEMLERAFWERHLGMNDITFSLDFQKPDQREEVTARIFVWNWNARIVVSDVDGTITRSDKRGIVMSALKLDWAHEGVAPLFSEIAENGYKMLYLSGRPRSRAESTRKYLKELKQRHKNELTSLPEGPVIVSPDRLVHSFWREVNGTEDVAFKIPYLEEIRGLFPQGDGTENPLFAGFGNRKADMKTYKKLGIPCYSRYSINGSQGGIDVTCNSTTPTDSFTYTALNEFVTQKFPKLAEVNETTPVKPFYFTLWGLIFPKK
ncbi:hypothetical protein KC19_2G166800 [Ceratodon purpureus]|uniref:LNS2/PITP domain-containing protein n=1 Tax=Ceratodon purpureus TaxID=3225 RepID=A0A8T0IWJ1_CERPU|nr:hypothetical protein KC19_2G166800 [Ceratodon purpureus]